MADGYTQEEIDWLTEAWEMRQTERYSMREIANKMDCDRLTLIEALDTWLAAGQPSATK